MTPIVGTLYRFVRAQNDQECIILLVGSRLAPPKMDCEPKTIWTVLTTFHDGRVVLAETWMIDRAMRENPEWFERVT